MFFWIYRKKVISAREMASWAGADRVRRASINTVRMRGVTEVVRRQLAEEGIPPFSDLFVPDIQDSAEPLLTDFFYVLGREEDCGRFMATFFSPRVRLWLFRLEVV